VAVLFGDICMRRPALKNSWLNTGSGGLLKQLKNAARPGRAGAPPQYSENAAYHYADEISRTYTMAG
jgi:hypothetical protein